MANRFLQNNSFLEDMFEQVEALPKEIGTEAWTQIKGQQKQTQNSDDNNNGGNNNKQQDDQVTEAERRRFINELYGKPVTKKMPIAQMSGDQLKNVKKQEDAKIRNNKNQIEQEIVAYRQKKAQEISAYERGMTQGTKGPKDQEEKMELWEEEKKKAEERKKKQDAITMPGSAQSRSGEQGVVMG